MPFLLSLTLWLFLFRDFLFFQTNTINLDTILSYAAVKFFINNLLNGVFPLWDPFTSGGVPFYSIVILGFFNPLIYVTALLVKCGIDYYSAYLVYLVTSFFIGAIGFYCLVKAIVQDVRVAFFAYLTLLFSGMSVMMFTQLNMLLIFVPSVWFFCFLVRYVKTLRIGDFLGMTFSLMLVMTSYIPFHFLTVFSVIFFFGCFCYGKKIMAWLPLFSRSVRKNFSVYILCAVALGVSILPLALYKISDANHDIVTPARHCSDKSAVACYEDTMNNTIGLSLEETTQYGTLAERLWHRSFFPNLDRVSYGMEVFFYVPVLCFVVFLLSIWSRFGRGALVVFLSLITIFLIAMGKTFGVYEVLYKFVPFFHYFRNLFFFTVFLIPMFILLTAIQLKNFLEDMSGSRAKNRWKVFWVSLTHLLFLIYLLQTREALWISKVSVLGSWIFWAGFFLLHPAQRHLWHGWWGLVLFGAVILVEPCKVFSFYNQNAKVFQCALPKTHVQPEFSFDRPQEEIDIPCAAKNFLTYIPEFWHEALMTDSPGRIGYPGTVGRGVFYLSKHMNPLSWSAYVQNKFILYDQIVPCLVENTGKSFPAENDRCLPALIGAIENNLNVAFVSNPDEALVKQFQSPSARAEHPLIVRSPADGLRVARFDVNSIEFETEFSKDKFLVYTESFNSHWKVFVNGVPAKLYQANSAFKGVWIPSGKNRVALRFHPPGGTGIYGVIVPFFCLFLVYTLYRLYRQTFLKRLEKDDAVQNVFSPDRKKSVQILSRGRLQSFVSVLNRSWVGYVLIFVVLSRVGDWKLAYNQHSRYLLGVFANGGFQNFHDGILYFDSMITADPNSADGWSGLGACYFNLGAYDKAIDAFQRALTLNPDSSRTRQLLKDASDKKISALGPPTPQEQIRLEFSVVSK